MGIMFVIVGMHSYAYFNMVIAIRCRSWAAIAGSGSGCDDEEIWLGLAGLDLEWTRQTFTLYVCCSHRQ